LKSSALAALSPKPEWFTDDISLSADSKVFIEQTCGKWIVEVPELSGKSKADQDRLKAAISRQSDRARGAYKRIAEERKRQFVFVATTNSEDYLVDTTGNRRYWPVKVGERHPIREDQIRRDRDQLWAEAAVAEAAGESIRLDPSLYPVGQEHQEERVTETVIFQILEEALDDVEGLITNYDIRKLLGEYDRTDPGCNERSRSLRKLGWEKCKTKKSKDRGWSRGNKESLKVKQVGKVFKVVKS
jgi:predicted P-loop ATPase